jgi:predicted AAA+ superfamily ATPase
MFFKRDLTGELQKYAKFGVIALLGPRQSGKTTLAKYQYPNHVFLDLEDLELRVLAQDDPKGFFRKYENPFGLILDEFQNVPELLSYIKVMVDQQSRPEYFILTGSQNFLVNEAISQSLAGRVGILTLLPLSIHELKAHNLLQFNQPELIIFQGSYPRIYSEQLEPRIMYSSYIHTYVERDVRQLINVTNLATFQKFMKLCAARIGQLINYSDLATQCGISVPTVHQWLSVLEASYLIFQLPPYWNNYTKRVTKTPKLYFYDTGLACALLGISSASDLSLNSFYGSLFENLIIADLVKQTLNTGTPTDLYFWRDRNGELEVDCLMVQGGQLTPIEIKSTETYQSHLFDGLVKWNKMADRVGQIAYLVYGGQQDQSGSNGINLCSWTSAGKLIK